MKPIISADSHVTDRTAFQVKDLCDVGACWADDFPHSDSTWPDSQAVLARQASGLTERERDLALHDNVAELYALSTPAA